MSGFNPGNALHKLESAGRDLRSVSERLSYGAELVEEEGEDSRWRHGRSCRRLDLVRIKL